MEANRNIHVIIIVIVVVVVHSAKYTVHECYSDRYTFHRAETNGLWRASNDIVCAVRLNEWVPAEWDRAEGGEQRVTTPSSFLLLFSAFICSPSASFVFFFLGGTRNQWTIMIRLRHIIEVLFARQKPDYCHHRLRSLQLKIPCSSFSSIMLFDFRSIFGYIDERASTWHGEGVRCSLYAALHRPQ